ncbi:unnamed protein product [Microthlaspi erraticum]|uniref:Uncharacterized protein n=1 Tax=Microthlaspi erraticum TaxID=1685480 RepID=A0A6D2HR36_9BRAS|nr:unnamed protein product [Microthlaspi erraticum]
MEPDRIRDQAMRKRRFVDALVEDMEREAALRSPVIAGNGQQQTEEEDDDHIILQWESRMDDDGSFQQYGSFMGYNVMKAVEAEPSQKKAQLSGETEDPDASEIEPLSDASDALTKLQADYIGSGTPSPNLSHIDGGAVGPVPPPVP